MMRQLLRLAKRDPTQRIIRPGQAIMLGFEPLHLEPGFTYAMRVGHDATAGYGYRHVGQSADWFGQMIGGPVPLVSLFASHGGGNAILRVDGGGAGFGVIGVDLNFSTGDAFSIPWNGADYIVAGGVAAALYAFLLPRDGQQTYFNATDAV